MSFLSLANDMHILDLPMSSPSLLIILLLNWLLWGCPFNPASVQHGLYLVYLLALSPLLSPIATLMALGSLVFLLALHLLFFFL